VVCHFGPREGHSQFRETCGFLGWQVSREEVRQTFQPAGAWPKGPAPERISEIQQALAKDGSFRGTSNGKWDDSTVEAIKKFQAGHGLNPSGKLDAQTLQKLGLGSQTAGVAAPMPPVATSLLGTKPTQIPQRQ